jgi:CelD/BcsL family acetyltransferase involved in cellulose biosynthesis
MDGYSSSHKSLYNRAIEFSPLREGAGGAWEQLFACADNATFQLMPQRAMSRGARAYGAWSDTGTLSALAALAPRTLRIVKGGPLGRALTLAGGWVLGNRLLGLETDESCQAFLAQAMELLRSGKFDCLYFNDLDTASPLWQAADALGQSGDATVLTPAGVQPHWWIDFPDPPEDYWGKFSSKSRNTMRRKAKKLPHELVKVERPEQVADFLTKAHAISTQTWQTRRLGLRVRNSTVDRSAYEQLAATGVLRSYLLENEGEPIAFVIGTQESGTFVYQEVGYDIRYAKSSPGTVLLFRVLEDLIAVDCPKRFDFGLGDAGYKQQFANRASESGALVIVSKRMRPRSIVAAHRVTHWLDQTGREFLRKTGLYDRVRRLYRQGGG